MQYIQYEYNNTNMNNMNITVIGNLEDENFLKLSNIREVDCKPLAQSLKGSEFTTLDLSNNKIGCNGLKCFTKILKRTQITTLNLKNNNIMDKGVKHLAKSIKKTQITELNLSNNNIGCNGLKYLTQVLKCSKITKLDLENNNIMDGDVKYLAESLKDTQITDLDLSENKIGTLAAEYLNKMLVNTKVRILDLDIHYNNTEDEDVDKYIHQTSYCDIRKIHITLHNNKIGIKGAQYLNKTFQNIAIAKLTLDRHEFEADDAQYLAQAFKDIKIYELKISSNHIRQLNGIQYLVQVFKDSHIYKLNLHAETIRITGAKYLAELLEEIKVLDLDLRHNYIGDEGVKCLAPVLKNSEVMFIDLTWNVIKAEGARYLSEILPNSKIISIDLCNNSIGVAGAKYLADGLPNSQVTSINLFGNDIKYAGYQYLLDVVDNTNIDRVDLHGNNIEAGLELYSIPRNTISVAYEICRVFEELVSLNPISNKFEFIIPRKDVDVDINQYAFLFKTLNDNPNSKVHIFHKMCKDHRVYHFNIMKKINEFITIMPNKFNTFFDNILPDLVTSFDSYNYNYANLVEQFEDMKLYAIVENLLLYRVLYYVDENQEILHPYIYKMLDKYGMPLYIKQLEPNKKEQIISYYQSHQEIDGVHAQEIIDLLGSEPFK